MADFNLKLEVSDGTKLIISYFDMLKFHKPD